MSKIPRRINNIIQDFITQVTELLGNRIKKSFYMALMLEEILMMILT